MKNISDAVHQFQFKEPSQVLFSLLGLLADWSQKLTTSSEMMTGQMPPSDTKATSVLALIEQGLKFFSVIQKRLHRSFQSELDKIFILSSQNIDEMTYIRAQDSMAQEMKTYQPGMAQQDFADTMKLIPVSDPNITSRAEVLITAQETLASVMKNPLSANNPQALYVATKNYYKALKAEDIDIICPEPQAPPPPPDLPPEEENAMMLREQGAQALPQQNHEGHLQSHQAFLESAWGEKLTPHGKKAMEAHEQEHMALWYMMTEQQKAQMIQQEAARLGA
jgi:hypothetical protein